MSSGFNVVNYGTTNVSSTFKNGLTALKKNKKEVAVGTIGLILLAFFMADYRSHLISQNLNPSLRGFNNS